VDPCFESDCEQRDAYLFQLYCSVITNIKNNEWDGYSTFKKKCAVVYRKFILVIELSAGNDKLTLRI